MFWGLRSCLVVFRICWRGQNCRTCSGDCGLGTVVSGLWSWDCGLGTVVSGLWSRDCCLGTVVSGLWSWDCGLGTVVLSSACASRGITVKHALWTVVLFVAGSLQHVLKGAEHVLGKAVLSLVYAGGGRNVEHALGTVVLPGPVFSVCWRGYNSKCALGTVVLTGMGGVHHVLKVTVSQLTVEHALGTVVLGLRSWDCGLGTVILSSACASGGIAVEKALGPAVLSGVSSVQHVPALISSSPLGSCWWGYSAESSLDVKRESQAARNSSSSITGGSCCKYHFCRDKHKKRVLSRQKYACRDKAFVVTKFCVLRRSIFVATKVLSRQSYF